MAKRKKPKPKDKINPNELKTRDPNQLALILGATKAGPQKDRKKEKDKYKARKPVNPEHHEE